MLLMFSLESQSRVCSSPSSVGVGRDIRGLDSHTTLSIPSSLVKCYSFDHARCLFWRTDYTICVQRVGTCRDALPRVQHPPGVRCVQAVPLKHRRHSKVWLEPFLNTTISNSVRQRLPLWTCPPVGAKRVVARTCRVSFVSRPHGLDCPD